MLNIDLYLELSDLFRFRLDPAILAVLAERPFRFRELEKQLEGHINDRIDDNTFDRGLKRLLRSQHAQATRTRVGQRQIKLYSITGDGLTHLRIYQTLIETYQHIELKRAAGN